ncbi:DNA sulfur modification protein DndB [Methylophaga thalassica]|uniref:DNA sulfur modification protein DndB n=1 Tax=Methylophaga aminisulfidivorans TaxID=230105 RepID=UPI0024E216AD|nr:DNA sulfur modification protein DndB [Methylophaga aminisulfidivorans]
MTIITSGTSFPAIRGIQAGSEYYIVMCPLKRLRKIFTFDESSLPVEARAQRILNEERIPEITNYILSQREDYAFSAITACIEGDSFFVPIGKNVHEAHIGTLNIDADAEVYITDGQHRNAAIMEALKKDPTLSEESISVVFFADKSLEERQKIFKDLNLYPKKADRSLGITYDNKPYALLSKELIYSNLVFQKLIDLEKNNLGPRSKKLLTHSAFNKATRELFDKVTIDNYKELIPIAAQYWENVYENLKEWQFVFHDKVSSGDTRKHSVNVHSVTLQALGIVGKQLIQTPNWESKLKRLKDINWDRSNKADWEGRCMINGEMSNNLSRAKATAIKIKMLLELPLTDKEQQQEFKLSGAEDEQ